MGQITLILEIVFVEYTRHMLGFCVIVDPFSAIGNIRIVDWNRKDIAIDVLHSLRIVNGKIESLISLS